ncbi:glycoside hydrolase family 18 protein [Streptomyces sp. NPDC055078]
MTAHHRPKARLRALIAAACTAVLGAALLTGTTSTASASAHTSAQPSDKVVGTFTNWSAYHPNRHIKNLHTSGAAAKLTHIRYFHGIVEDRGCFPGDGDTDFSKYYSAEDSVDGVADSWQRPGWGSVNQLRKLKKLHPHLKVIWSFTRWNQMHGLGESRAEARRLARSCRALVEDSRWGDVFDGIDVDWTYAHRDGDAFGELMSAMRAEFGGDLVTATIPGDAAPGGGIDATDFTDATEDVDWFNVLTYRLYGWHESQGPTAPHAPLRAYPGIPNRYATVDAAIRKLKEQDIPARKLLPGISFEGHGWRGVTQSAPGGSAAGLAYGSIGNTGSDHYRVLKSVCPVTGRIAGMAYAHCGTDWWSYETPDTVAEKVAYAKRQKLGGTHLWELASDTPDGELINAVR